VTAKSPARGDPESRETQSKPSDGLSNSELRLTLLVNYWHQRPSAPICCDYDGSIYPSLADKIAARELGKIAVSQTGDAVSPSWK